MASETKLCEWCASEFQRPSRLSRCQWEGRRFCSKQCSASKFKLDEIAVVSAYLGGLAVNAVAERFGVSITPIKRVLVKNGIPLRTASEAISLSHSSPEFRKLCSVRSTGRSLPESAKAKLRERVGPRNANWRGGITHDASGYRVYTRSPANGPHAGRHVHRVIAEQVAGRPLRSDEHVHHIDFNKTNNDPANLRVMNAQDHHQLHAIASGLVRKNHA